MFNRKEKIKEDNPKEIIDKTVINKMLDYLRQRDNGRGFEFYYLNGRPIYYCPENYELISTESYIHSPNGLFDTTVSLMAQSKL